MAGPSFLSEAPKGPVEFEVGGWRWSGKGEDRERVEVREAFWARRDVSYGVLLRDIEAADTGQGSLLNIFDRVLVDPDHEPDDTEPGDDTDDLSPEALRFRAFAESEDIFVSQRALLAAVRWIAGEQADRPTGSPDGSRSTRRAGGRGSGARRR